jgi:Protein of unknown function (DUF4242)
MRVTKLSRVDVCARAFKGQAPSAATRGLARTPVSIVVNYADMRQFVIERDLPGAGKLSEAELRDLSMRSLEALNEMGPQIQWLHSYVTEDKVYCVYLAPDENIIREHARRAGIPADRVSAVRRLIDPVNFG